VALAVILAWSGARVSRARVARARPHYRRVPTSLLAQAGLAAPTGDKVKFLVASHPAGATVFVGSQALGDTPLELDVPRGADGRGVVELTFSLPGYRKQTIRASGSGRALSLNQKLEPDAK
jgi:hypothetical protein